MLTEAAVSIGEFRRRYDEYGPHKCIGYETPIEVRMASVDGAWRETQAAHKRRGLSKQCADKSEHVMISPLFNDRRITFRPTAALVIRRDSNAWPPAG